jgi:hypothetical protein
MMMQIAQDVSVPASASLFVVPDCRTPRPHRWPSCRKIDEEIQKLQRTPTAHELERSVNQISRRSSTAWSGGFAARPTS